MTSMDLHREQGVPWRDVARTFRAASTAHRLRDTDSEWRGYVAVCEADGTPPLSISVETVMAWWASRILGSKLKSSALKSVASRLLTHASLLGYEAPLDVVTAIGRELQYVYAAFPCEVTSATPLLLQCGGWSPLNGDSVRKSKGRAESLLPCAAHLLLTS